MPSPMKCAWCQRTDAKSLTVHIIAGVRHLLCSDCHEIRLANNPAGVYLRVGEAERREKPKADETLRLPDNWPLVCPECGAPALCGEPWGGAPPYQECCRTLGHAARCGSCGHKWQPGEAGGEHDHTFSSGGWRERELVAEEPLAPGDLVTVTGLGSGSRSPDGITIYGEGLVEPGRVLLPGPTPDSAAEVLPVPQAACGADETRLAWAKDFSLKVWLIRKGNTLTADIAHQDDRWRGRDAGGVTRTLAGETRQYQVASDWGPAIYESVTGDTDLYLRGLDRDCDGWSSSYMYPSPELAQEALEAFTEIIAAAKLPEGAG